ncbi:MAG: transglutaminase domain-containing protein [Ruminococcus sp.]|nr:transglutaminase domain-containing protein [Ruminococcus sp.]
MKKNKSLTNNGIVLKREMISDFSNNDIGFTYLFRIFLVMLTSICTIGAFVSSIKMEMNLTALILFDIVATLLLCSFKLKSKIVKVCSIFVIGIIVLFFILKTKDIILGFQHIINKYLEAVDAEKLFNDISNINKYSYINLSYTLILFLVIVGLCFTLFYRFSFIGTLSLTFPFLELGIFWGFVPDYFCFFVLLCVWFIVLCSQNCIGTNVKYSKGDKYLPKTGKNVFYSNSESQIFHSGSRASIFIAVLSLIVLVFSLIISSIYGDRPDSINNTRLSIKNALENFEVEEIPSYVDDILGNFNINTNFSDNPDFFGGRLGNKSKIKFKNKVMLEIEIEDLFTANVLYLKGVSSGVYNKNSWKQLDADVYKDYEYLFDSSEYDFQDYSSLLINNSSVVPTEPKKIFIEDKTQSNCFYMPYSADFSTITNTYTVNDLYLKTTENSYSYSYENHIRYSESIPNYQEFLLPMNLEDYIEYEDFVYENYLDFDDEIIRNTYNEISIEAFESYFDYLEYGHLISYESYFHNLDDMLSISEYKNYLDYDCLEDGFLNLNAYRYDDINCVNNVSALIQKYFDDNYTYTLEPGRTPMGEDFVQYFLEEQKKGYCTYFASAGTLLMRAFGFPARYVEGYVAPREEFLSDETTGTYRAEIKDKYAHAWCEVFVKSIGWIPVEFTPNYEDAMENYVDPETTTTTKKETTTTTKKEEITSTSKDNHNSNPDNNNEDSTTITTLEHKSPNGNKTDYEKIIRIVVSTVLVIVSILLLLYLWKLIYDNKRRKHETLVSDSDRNKAIIEIYGYLLKILSAVKVNVNDFRTDIQDASSLYEQLEKFEITVNPDEFNEFIILAVEADMSRNIVTEDSYEFAFTLYNKLRNEIYTKVSPLRKLILKYFRFLY